MSYWENRANFRELAGKTLVAINGLERGGERVTFVCSDGSEYVQYHEQDCCEGVDIDDVIGDVKDIIGSPVLVADESSNSDGPGKGEYVESFTWTFYKIDTAKGGVTIKWYGQSNGYYSESVSFYREKPPADFTAGKSVTSVTKGAESDR